MLRFLLTQLGRSFGVFVRTIRAFFSRKLMGATTQVRKLANFSQSISKTAASSVQSVMSAAQSPTKREDYVEIGRLLVSKALIIRILLGIVALGAFIYLVAWPFVLGHFLTARFFKEDTRIETWNGRVIVYADKKKTVPMYAGRLTNGVLQGAGREYDGKGLLSYEGEFQDGVRSGRGIAYERGLMVYQGEFGDGVYQGNGVLYGKGGLRIYEGHFAAGLYDGSGRLYNDEYLSYEGQFSAGIPEGEGKRYAEKVLFYAGGFHEGLPHGEGVTYYPDGTAFYRGGFSAGIFDGNGTEYNENGSIRYTGAFSEGKYNGNGSLYVAEGEHLDAEFQDGEPTGVVRWVRDGRLYYEGEWSADAPSGFGALYDKAGKQIYQGQFFGGSPDGRWMMSLSLDDLRAAMGQANQESVPGGSRGFLIVNAALGLRVLCSYRTENADSQILAAYLSAPGDGWARLLPGAAHVPLGTSDAEGTVWLQETVSLSPPTGANLSAGRYDARTADFPDSRVMILYRNGAANAVIWESVGNAAAGAGSANAGSVSGTAGSGSANAGNSSGTAGSGSANAGNSSGTSDSSSANAGSAAETQMETFLHSIDDMETGAGVISVSVRPEYGDADPGAALSASASAEAATELADALLIWWEQAERQAALEENLARTDALLSEAQTALSMGTGDEKTVSALEEKKAALSDAVEVCKAERKKAELRGPAGTDFALLDVSAMSVFFDPGGTDVSRVALTAVAYAQTTGKDEAEAETKAKTALVDLKEAYDGARAALNQYEEAQKNAQTAAQDYSIGSGSKTAWSDALSAQSDAKSAVTSALSAFSRQANALNALTGGWVSRTYGWHEAEFVPLFEAAVLPPAPAEELSGENATDTETSGNEISGTDTANSGSGASTDNAASGSGTSTDNGSSGSSASAGNGASGSGTSTGNGASGSGTSMDNGGSGSGTSTDNGSSGSGTSTDNVTSGGETDAAQTDPDSDEAIYGGLTPQSDSGQTERINGPRVGPDGKVYPFDPEDEMLQLAREQGANDADTRDGESLIGLLESLLGVSKEED